MSGGDAIVRTLAPPIPKSVFEYVINPLMEVVLRSPLHSLVSDSSRSQTTSANSLPTD